MKKNNISKVILSITLSLTMILTTSCKRFDFQQPYNKDKESIRVGKAILNALSEHDEEAFRDLFCERAKEQENFSEQVKQAMLFFEGEIEEFPYEGDLTASGGEAWDDGVLVDMHISDDIEDIKTNQQKVYHIHYYGYVVNKKVPDEEGVIEITIKGEDGVCEVGGWE